MEENDWFTCCESQSLSLALTFLHFIVQRKDDRPSYSLDLNHAFGAEHEQAAEPGSSVSRISGQFENSVGPFILGVRSGWEDAIIDKATGNLYHRRCSDEEEELFRRVSEAGLPPESQHVASLAQNLCL